MLRGGNPDHMEEFFWWGSEREGMVAAQEVFNEKVIIRCSLEGGNEDKEQIRG